LKKTKELTSENR